ncbi:MAG: PEP-CTERM sorting domain-containing protein, partial [Planctomycetaceae bacterium]|nr:PEP-CTERM sorting domain-containing protein [Planctomycetaceae bacterium]
AAGFSAALAANFDASDLSASIVSIDFNPKTIAWTSQSTRNPVSMSTVGGKIAGFNQWNDSVGKTLIFDDSNMASWRSASNGEVINTSTFVGDTGSWSEDEAATGVVYQAFRSLAGNVGWFAWDLGGLQGAVTYVSGQYGNAGESVKVGTGGGGTVPEPGHVGLSLLALGAVGLRRRRALKKQTAGE